MKKLAAGLLAALAIAQAPTVHAQTIEGCEYSDTEGQWVYSDDQPCRGTGEDPTVDSEGLPACALGRLAVPRGERVRCIDPAGHHGGGHGHGRTRHA